VIPDVGWRRAAGDDHRTESQPGHGSAVLFLKLDGQAEPISADFFSGSRGWLRRKASFGGRFLAGLSDSKRILSRGEWTGTR